MNVRNLAIWGALALLVIGMAVMMGGNPEVARAQPTKLSEIYQLAEQGKIAEATLGDTTIIAKTTDGRTLKSELRALDMKTEDGSQKHRLQARGHSLPRAEDRHERARA